MKFMLQEEEQQLKASRKDYDGGFEGHQEPQGAGAEYPSEAWQAQGFRISSS
jgi:hypothetical protein